MILAQFPEQKHNKYKKKQTNNKSNNSHNDSSIHNSKFSNISGNILPQKTVQTYLDQLGIQNVIQIYQKNQKKKQENNKTLINTHRQFLKQSVQRLYNHKKPTLHKPQNQHHQNQQQEPHQFYQDIANLQPNYDNRFLTLQLQKKINKTQQNFLQIYEKKFKITNKIQFYNSIIKFLFSQSKFQDQDQLMLEYNNFVNCIKDDKQIVMNREQKNWKDLAKFLEYVNKVPYFYWLVNFDTIEKEELRQLNSECQWAKKVTQESQNPRNIAKIYQKFQNFMQAKFTIPFQTKLYFLKKEPLKVQQVIHVQNFKANPIPKSTYQKKNKQRPKTCKKTKAEPFKFAEAPYKQQLIPDKLYNWPRTFKAKPVPKTTYQKQFPQKTQKQKNQWKKQHCQKLLQLSKYPDTMKYLQNYDKFTQQKQQQLHHKYHKNRQQIRSRPKQIPNFTAMHKHQIQQLQQFKKMNRTNTKTIPFNFQQHKKLQKSNKNTLLSSYQQQQHQQKPKKSTQNNFYHQAKSTAKFDAYVQLRQQQKQQKQIQKEQQQKYKKIKQENLKTYKNILKQRMYEELQNQPKTRTYDNNYNNNNQMNNKVKVNLEQIYLNKPLLMSSTQNNSKNKNFQTATNFTDTFQPII